MLDDAVRQLERKLASKPNLRHLRVKQRGKALTIYSDSPQGPDAHARLTSLGSALWG